MTMTWDISFLLDHQGKIEEARGHCLDLLGEPARSLVGRSFLPFVATADRAHFRRFLGQLNNTNAVRRALLHLRTTLNGDRPFFMEAQNGWSTERHWIMLALPKDQVGANPLAVLDAPIPVTSDDDLLMLIELAAEQATSLDLTTFSVGALTPTDEPRPSTPASEQLRRQVERSLIANALDGVVSQSSPGVYNVLHNAETPAEKIAADMVAGAQEVGVSSEQLGLIRRTIKLGLHPNRAKIQAAVAETRAPIQDRSLPVGVVVEEAAPSRIKPIYYVIGALLLFLLGVGISAVIAFG